MNLGTNYTVNIEADTGYVCNIPMQHEALLALSYTL